MNIATEIRATTQRIIQRHYGHLPDAIAAIRISDVVKIDAFVEQAQDRLSRCTCQDAPGFEIIERATGGYRALERARIDRLVADDARGVRWSAL